MQTRRVLLTAYRYACPDSPAACGARLVEWAVTAGLVEPRGPVPGETLRSWGIDGKPPLWAALAAGRWLRSQDYTPGSPAERDALALVENFHM